MPVGLLASYYSLDTGAELHLFFPACPADFNVQGEPLQLKFVRPDAFQNPCFNGSSNRKLPLVSAVILLCGFLALPKCARSQVDAGPLKADSPSAAEQPPATGMEWSSEAASVAPGKVPWLSEINPPPLADAGAKFSSSLGSARFGLPVESGSTEQAQARPVTEDHPKSPAQEFIVEGLISYGNYRLFGTGYDEKLFTAGVEYDRHSWDYFLKAQVDYVAEFLPFVLLDKPLSTNIYAYPTNPVAISKQTREYVPGVGIFPIGFRMQWRSNRSIKPYLEAKGGMLGFTKKVPSSQATYENFSFQAATGIQVKMTDRWGLRLGLFSDFHFSDAFIVEINPGLDVMNANLGLSYHF